MVVKTAYSFQSVGVTANERTANSKLTTDPILRRIAVTYVSQNNCPTDCVLKDNGCYAEGGPTGIITKRLTRSGETDILTIAQNEAECIDALSGTAPLRLHIVGDCPTNEAARIVSAAAERYIERSRQLWLMGKLGGVMSVFAYTHAWRVVDRESWGSVSIIASCDTVSDIALARSRGYPTALVIDYPTSKPADKAFLCPQTTGAVADCMSCGVCFNRHNADAPTVCFPVHGARIRRAREAIMSLPSMVAV